MQPKPRNYANNRQVRTTVTRTVASLPPNRQLVDSVNFSGTQSRSLVQYQPPVWDFGKSVKQDNWWSTRTASLKSQWQGFQLNAGTIGSGGFRGIQSGWLAASTGLSFNLSLPGYDGLQLSAWRSVYKNNFRPSPVTTTFLKNFLRFDQSNVGNGLFSSLIQGYIATADTFFYPSVSAVETNKNWQYALPQFQAPQTAGVNNSIYNQSFANLARNNYGTKIELDSIKVKQSRTERTNIAYIDELFRLPTMPPSSNNASDYSVINNYYATLTPLFLPTGRAALVNTVANGPDNSQTRIPGIYNNNTPYLTEQIALLPSSIMVSIVYQGSMTLLEKMMAEQYMNREARIGVPIKTRALFPAQLL